MYFAVTSTFCADIIHIACMCSVYRVIVVLVHYFVCVCILGLLDLGPTGEVCVCVCVEGGGGGST